MIDAAWVGSNIDGGTGSGDYTTVAFVTGVGKGLTVTPAKGDTTKNLLFTNSGVRYPAGNLDQYPASGHLWPATQSGATSAWYIDFSSSETLGRIYSNPKPRAFSLRCVRS